MLVDSAMAAVEADPRSAIIVRHRRVVRVVDHRHVYVVYRPVVIKMVLLPAPTFIPAAKIAESIIDPTVKTHYRAPIAFMKVISTAPPGPISGRPEESRLRRQHPGTRHPVIIVPVPRPISGRPEVSLARADRLLINRQLRWTERNGDSYSNLRVGCAGQQQETYESQ